MRLSLITALALSFSLPFSIEAEESRRRAAVQLFDGESLKGWYTFIKGRGRDLDPEEVFTVRDGVIHISGEEWGCLTSEEEFEDYRLAMEWRWTGETHGDRKEKSRDSGLLIHSQGEDGGYSGTWMHSIEVQMIEGGTGDFIVVGNGTDEFRLTATVADEKQGSSHVFDDDGKPVTINSGRINWWGRSPAWEDVIDFRGEQDVERKVGEWNTLEVESRQGHVVVHLNGVKVNEALETHPRKGRIQIQSEGAGLEVRKVELAPFE